MKKQSSKTKDIVNGVVGLLLNNEQRQGLMSAVKLCVLQGLTNDTNGINLYNAELNIIGYIRLNCICTALSFSFLMWEYFAYMYFDSILWCSIG